VIQKIPEKPAVLLVEDDLDQAELVQRGLQQSGFRVAAVRDARSALHRMALDNFKVIVSDLSLPGMNGDELLRHIRLMSPGMPFLMLTGSRDVATAVQSMHDGADEYLLKPVTPSTLSGKVLAAIERRGAYEAEAKRNRGADMATLIAFLRGVRSMVNALETKDQYTRDHSKKVAQASVMMARHVPGMGKQEIREIRIGALLHDIGKIGIPLTILHKEGKLDDEEWLEIKRHPEYGARILEPLGRYYPEVLAIVRHEHERWDGRGYPDGIAGTEIPLGSRLIMIADTYDAVCSTRPYRKALPKSAALEIIREGAGTQFDPELVSVFEQVLPELPLPRY
jgi:cyclic di-GMP phosphodiesterase